MAPLSDGQVISLIVSSTISAGLSVVGSSFILCWLLKTKKRASVYRRIMLGMSMIEVVTSFFIMIQPYLIPADGGRLWAHGNQQTCSMFGFFFQIGTAVPLYNVSLNTYFLLTVAYGMSEAKFAKQIEPAMHAIPILYPLLTACIGAGIHLYSELELGIYCWIGEYPKDCDTDPDVDCSSTIIAWIWGGIPFVGSFLFLVISNTIIYCKVRATTRKTKRYRSNNHVPPTNSCDSSMESQPEATDGVFNRVKVYFDRGKENAVRATVTPPNPTSAAIREQDVADIAQGLGFGTSMFQSQTKPTPPPAFWFWFQRRESIRREDPKLKAVAMQATLYVAACCNTVIWMAILRTFESNGVHREDESDVYWLSLLTCITFPLNGFWNMFIFIRPRYLRLRQRKPPMSRWWAFRECLSMRDFPDRVSLVDRSSQADRSGHRGRASQVDRTSQVDRNSQVDRASSPSVGRFVRERENLQESESVPRSIDFSQDSPLRAYSVMLKGSENLESSSSSCSDPDEARMMYDNSEGLVIGHHVNIENSDQIDHDTLIEPIYNVSNDPQVDDDASSSSSGVIA